MIRLAIVYLFFTFFLFGFCKAEDSTRVTKDSINFIIGDISFVDKYGYLPDVTTDEDLRIRTHLEYVEKLLRQKNCETLSFELQAQRNHILDLLHDYYEAGIFPRNYDYSERRPCFIDKDGRICAVGYLVEKTAGRNVAEKINEKYKYEALMAMKDEALDSWIASSGLSKEECAVIQPGYKAPTATMVYCEPSFIEGKINCMAKDERDSILVLGGKFTIGTTKNIVSFKDTLPIPLGEGLSGEIIDCFVSGKNIYATGKFMIDSENYNYQVFKWDGKKWSKMGIGFNDKVSKLVIYNNILYAGGSFSKEGENGIKFLSVWNGTAWKSLSHNFEAPINALCVKGKRLYVAGDSSKSSNVMYLENELWSDIGINGVNIKTLAFIVDTLYAGGVSYNQIADSLFAERIGPTNIEKYSNPRSKGYVPYFGKLNSTGWMRYSIKPNGSKNSMVRINSLYQYKDTLILCGTFTMNHKYFGSLEPETQGYNTTLFSSYKERNSRRQIWSRKPEDFYFYPFTTPFNSSTCQSIHFKNRFYITGENIPPGMLNNLFYTEVINLGYSWDSTHNYIDKRFR